MKPGRAAKHPIQVAARRSGVSQDVIRAWERRYGAVTPDRSGTNRRLYSDEDVERLYLLAQVTRAGRRIGDVARLPTAQLKDMANADREAEARVGSAPSRPAGADTRRHLEACLAAVRDLDAESLESTLAAAALDMSPAALAQHLLMPLMHTVGDLWRQGELRVAHEHLATSLVRSFLATLARSGRTPVSAPDLIVATPAGQMHELGALVVGLTASAEGWRVTYLGADLPADEIAAAARQRSARAVALSITHPPDDPGLARELRGLAAQLGSDVALLAGGRAAAAYRDCLDEIGASLVHDVTELQDKLVSLRGPAAS